MRRKLLSRTLPSLPRLSLIKRKGEKFNLQGVWRGFAGKRPPSKPPNPKNYNPQKRSHHMEKKGGIKLKKEITMQLTSD